MTNDTHTPFATAIIAACPGVSYLHPIVVSFYFNRSVVLPFYVAYLSNKIFTGLVCHCEFYNLYVTKDDIITRF